MKFTLERKIAVPLRAVGGAVELEGADTGEGLPPEEIERVFERFHRVEGARGRTHEAPGIGLALVRELASLEVHPLGGSDRDRHGRTVRRVAAVGSRTEGAGTTFTVSSDGPPPESPESRSGSLAYL